jgi:hypothetical protein
MENKIHRKINFGQIILLLLILSGCSPLWGKPGDVGSLLTTATLTPFLRVDYLPVQTTLPVIPFPTLFLSPLATEPQEKIGIWMSKAVPAALRESISSQEMQMVVDPSTAAYHLEVQSVFDTVQTNWIYALVAPFPTIMDDVTWSELQAAWQGIGIGSFASVPLLMDEATLDAISGIWGAPAIGSVQISPVENMVDSAWTGMPSWGIVPFEALEPRWKVISIDGNSPLSNEFNPDKYPLKVGFGFREGEGPTGFVLQGSNRDPEKLTMLIMTGVTAMVRATAAKMERLGVLYPAQDIRSWLVSADITHISNEIPFSDTCPYPDPNQTTLVFCSDPKYIGLMEDVGTDVVELTGNHFQDWGSEATLLTLEMYNQRGWVYFGGGADLTDARAAKTIFDHGNKLAFIGCNPAGPQYAWATDSQPGAAPCDYDWMHTEISRLRSEGYLPIVTFQYIESYSIHPSAEQVEDFRSMAESGAVIVLNGSFIHYGLGNLFFDQMDIPAIGTRKEFIDRHVFYDGKYIGTDLLTAMLEDYSQPRPMTEEERKLFLDDIFTASGW